jgi:branched-subunit amino acid transport protein
MHWLIIVVVGIATYAIRVSGIALLAGRTIPTGIQRALRFVPMTVLPAMIAQEVILVAGTPDISLSNERLLAGLVAAAVAWRTKNVLVTIVVGMGSMLLLQAAGL